MKILFLLFISLSLLHCKEDDDTLKYQEAYNNIVSSTLIQQDLKDLFGDTSSIWVSTEVLSFSYWPFEDEIMQFKYYYEPDSIKTILKDFLSDFPSSNPLQKEKEYLNTFNTETRYSLLLFFSEVNNQWLSAEIFKYDDRFSKKYYEAIKMPVNVLHILFYFENNIIRKVFLAKGSRH